jgi:DHA2 family multidrug resistance protein-like MFS transporter
VIASGLTMAAIALVMLTQLDGSAELRTLVVASVIISLGLAPVFTATTDLIVGSAPPEEAGAASGISETGAELGGALGIAILGSIGTAVYRAQLLDLVPAGVPAHATEAARDTLGAAGAAAEGLPAISARSSSTPRARRSCAACGRARSSPRWSRSRSSWSR